ncbi:cation-translocating P-type ATPase [Novosphingobium sp. PY1]|uniref:cation-translocating P-type ATPase n=1 Tax=Novosphingobium sp. PY1 TaxID=1882221 RepID=UPI000BE77893|nr:cation-translocating P-type ATPase [Novosphingobium sp. PY1]BBA74153.1 P-type HAD superfamily ATPase [Novosphingobium sp. PY1]GFM31390.1 P-type HAD superfamily ATPase [Novosphingobium sp. PY1]
MDGQASGSMRRGLPSEVAAARLREEGPNALPGARSRSPLRIVRDVLREPMLLLLLAAGGIYLLLGDLHEALILLAFAGLTVVIAIVQEARTERAIDSLRDLSMPQALVIRDGHRQRIPSREVVRGDLMVVGEGDRVAADGWVIEGSGLQADESLLTGESVPVAKPPLEGEPAAQPPRPGGEDLPYLFAGTLAVRGAGTVEVAATGLHSEIGRIGQSLVSLETEVPHLTLQTKRLVRWLAVLGLGVSVLAILLYGLLRGGWLEAFLSGIAIAMSLLPEELPVVLTLFMTMGAFRMAQRRVLARRGSAIETLGAATVLCTDKTGTLTKNRMAIAELRLPDGSVQRLDGENDTLGSTFAELAALGISACLEEPFDPMEQAFHALDDEYPERELKLRKRNGWHLHRQYPLSSQLLAMANVWTNGTTSDGIVAAKGAPEAIAQLCGMTDDDRATLEADAAQMACKGLRVLGIAEARWQGGSLPDDQSGFAFTFRGLVGLADPIRASVPPAVTQLQEAGIRLVMITGDYPATARAIARQAGIVEGDVLSGDEIARLDDAELVRRVGGVAVFARVMPDQKLRIVRALKAMGEVVAMTGDGVNDAPSLKAAHIGIAMGERGTDVAREASSVVLLDDDFGSIVTAVRLGRRIYDNLRKAVGFIFAVHIPIGGLAIFPLLAGWPLILGPVHIALLEMVIDPVCSLAFEAEPEEPDIMRRPPRAPESPLISRSLLGWSLMQGFLVLASLLLLSGWASHGAIPADAARTTSFAGLIVAVLALVLANRSFRSLAPGGKVEHNLPLAIIMGLVVGVFSAVFLSPTVASLLGFSVLQPVGMQAVGITALFLGGALSLAKLRFGRVLTN